MCSLAGALQWSVRLNPASEVPILNITSFKKSESSKLKDLSDEIQRLDAQYSNEPSETLYKKPIQLQLQYKLSSGRTERQLLHVKQWVFFEMGKKAGKLPAHQAWAEASRLIQSIKLDSGDITSDPTTLLYYSCPRL